MKKEFRAKGYFKGGNSTTDTYMGVLTLEDGEDILTLIEKQNEAIRNLQSQIKTLREFVERGLVKLN